MTPEPTLMVRGRGGRGWAPSLAVWAPILVKLAAALVAAAVLAMIGIRASGKAWHSAASPMRGDVGDPVVDSTAAAPGPVSRGAVSTVDDRSDPTQSVRASGAPPRTTAGVIAPSPATDGGVGADGGPASGAQTAAMGALRDGRIVLNGASEEQLVLLPGIGPARARAILALRERLGRFRSIDQLRRVKGIGRKTLQKIAPNVVVDVPHPSNIEMDAG